MPKKKFTLKDLTDQVKKVRQLQKDFFTISKQKTERNTEYWNKRNKLLQDSKDAEALLDKMVESASSYMLNEEAIIGTVETTE